MPLVSDSVWAMPETKRAAAVMTAAMQSVIVITRPERHCIRNQSKRRRPGCIQVDAQDEIEHEYFGGGEGGADHGESASLQSALPLFIAARRENSIDPRLAGYFRCSLGVQGSPVMDQACVGILQRIAADSNIA